ncbi:MAG: sortase domain-containing protein, partial [Pseudonocardiaceae bacterium]
LEAGDGVRIERADGRTAVFTVTRVEQIAKTAFPTEAVYGDTSDSQLRLITCGGDFDGTERRYLDNIIVYAARAG